MNDIPLKRCTKCGGELPATTEYFHRDQRGQYGLKAKCKKCATEIALEWAQNNPDRARENNRRWGDENPDRRRANQRKAYQRNPEVIRARARRWYSENRDKARESTRRWVQNNREQHDAARLAWQRRNTDKVYEYTYRHRKANPQRSQIYTQRRRARKKSLPDTFVHSQWVTCLEWFGQRCAYCGKQGDSQNVLAADHFIPLSASNCPGTIAKNIVPSCRNCNSSKQDKTPDVWVKRSFKWDAEDILRRIREYFDSLD